jgi:hypothetical protein
MFPIGNMRQILNAIRSFKENNQSMGYKEEFGSHNEVSEGPFKRPVPFVDQQPNLGSTGVIKRIHDMTMNKASNAPEAVPGDGGYNSSEEL